MFYVISNMNYSKHVCKTMLKALNYVHLFRINQNVKCDLTFIKYAFSIIIGGVIKKKHQNCYLQNALKIVLRYKILRIFPKNELVQ